MSGKTKKKPKAQAPAMRAKTYSVMHEAVDLGISTGLTRARKHTDSPTDDILKEQLSLSIMNSICEYFEFD